MNFTSAKLNLIYAGIIIGRLLKPTSSAQHLLNVSKEKYPSYDLKVQVRLPLVILSHVPTKIILEK